MRRQGNIAKWGFGMAPISSRMRQRYDHAVQTTLDLLYGNPVDPPIVVDALSELKGMFNRCVRKDQWDYAMVHEELGAPAETDTRRIVGHLINLRRGLVVRNQGRRRAAPAREHQYPPISGKLPEPERQTR